MAGDITRLLGEWQGGRLEAGEELVALTYRELRNVARAYLRRERAGHTLQPTALLNEAYLRLLPHGPREATSREAFFRLMASEMRHRLVDHARRRLAEKRGAGAVATPLDTSIGIAAPHDGGHIEAMFQRLDRAVETLAIDHPRTSRVVQLRFLAGLTTEETATELGLSAATVKREWTFARAWLAAALSDEESGPAAP